MALIKIGVESQVDVMVHETCAESRDYPAAIAEACQALAQEKQKPVVFTAAHGDRHIFYPQPKDIYDQYYGRKISR